MGKGWCLMDLAAKPLAVWLIFQHSKFPNVCILRFGKFAGSRVCFCWVLHCTQLLSSSSTLFPHKSPENLLVNLTMSLPCHSLHCPEEISFSSPLEFFLLSALFNVWRRNPILKLALSINLVKSHVELFRLVAPWDSSYCQCSSMCVEGIQFCSLL